MHTLNQTRPTTLSPAQIGTMLAQRRERAQKEKGNYGLFRQPNGVWSVVSLKGEAKVYETTQYACTCPDFARHGAALSACKHVYLVRSAEEERLEEIQRERVKEARRKLELDYPTDDYDRKPAAQDPFGSGTDPTPEKGFWDDQVHAARYAAWLADEADRADNWPAD